MTVIVSRRLGCNGRPEGVGCPAEFTSLFPGLSTPELRASAHYQGWTYREGNDFCPACTAATTSKGSTR